MQRREHLRQLLRELRPTDAVEAQHLARMHVLLGSNGDPFSREHYLPGHFTASAFIVSADRSAMLLILHGKLGRWLQPGGHIDAGDTNIVGAARREVAEEVGLHDLPLLLPGIFDVDVHTIPARGSSPAHEHFDVRFAFAADAQLARAGSDARDARWVKLAQVEQIESDASVMRAVHKLRAEQI